MTTLTEALERSHGTISARSVAAHGGRAHRSRDDFDAEVAALSGHPGATESVLYPLARRALPDGHAVAAAQLRLARRVEQVLRLLQGRLYGDTLTAELSVDDLQGRLDDLVADLLDGERVLVRRLEQTLPEQASERAAAALDTALRHAPTRPHPYVPHPRGLSRLILGAVAVWDRAFDVMDNRVVPAVRPPRRARPLTAWDRYLLGRPDFDSRGPDSSAGSSAGSLATPRRAPHAAGAAARPSPGDAPGRSSGRPR